MRLSFGAGGSRLVAGGCLRMGADADDSGAVTPCTDTRSFGWRSWAVSGQLREADPVVVEGASHSGISQRSKSVTKPAKPVLLHVITWS